jgi:hypothetical protein
LLDSHIDMIRFSTNFDHTATFSKLSVDTAFTVARHVIFLVELSGQETVGLEARHRTQDSRILGFNSASFFSRLGEVKILTK